MSITRKRFGDVSVQKFHHVEEVILVVMRNPLVNWPESPLVQLQQNLARYVANGSGHVCAFRPWRTLIPVMADSVGA